MPSSSRDAELQVRDPVRGAGVVGLVRAHPPVDAHRQRLGGRALGRARDDRQPCDAVRSGASRRAGARARSAGRRARARRAPGRPGRPRRRRRSPRRAAGAPPCPRALGSTRRPPRRRSRARVAPSWGSSSSSAMRQRGTRQLRAAALRTTGREIASARARRRCREHLVGDPRRRRRGPGASSRPGRRSSCPSERTMSSAAASRVEPRAGLRPERPRCGGRGGRAPRSSARGRRRRRSGRARTRARRSRPRAAAGPRRRRTACAAGGSRAAGRTRRPARPAAVDGGAPVGLDAELVRGEAIRLAAGDERHRLGRALLEQRVQLRDGLASRQAADVDARDLGPLGELVPRAGEREADEDGEHDDDPAGGRERPRVVSAAATTADSRA